MKYLYSLLVGIALMLPAATASAARLDHWDAISHISGRFEENTILNDIRSVHPCTAPDGSRFCTKADGTKDDAGYGYVIEKRQHNYDPLQRVCMSVRESVHLSNDVCDKGARPFDRDPFDGK